MITIKTYNIIDLFSGAGGLSLGFKQTGKINIVAAAENNPNARKTYKRNFAEVKRLYPDVRTIDYNELKEAVGQVDIVIGGPPCQGFSNANRQHSTIISMNNRLVKEYVRAICELQPTAFVMENVAMLKSQVHRFFLEENDMTNAKILNLPLREDNIEILPQNMNFEGSRELILSAPNGVQYAWAETFYKTINLLYRYRINQPKFDLSLTKYEKKLVPQLQELFRGFNGTESSNRIQQKDSFMAIQILNYIENKEKREESFDRVIQAIRDSLLIQRALLKVKELSDNNIHVFDYVEKDGGLYATVKSYSVLDYLQGILENEPYNYTLKCDTLNAISFGAPRLKRTFYHGWSEKDLNIEYTYPEATFTEGSYRTVRDAISDIQDIEPGKEVTDSYFTLPPHPEAQGLEKELRGRCLHNHITTATRETALSRFKALKAGENFHDLSPELKTTYSNAERTQNTIYMRLKYDEPSGTVVNVRKSMWIHPELDRAISIREAARLQTFPDSFIFEGTKDSQYQQVGNAVPPFLAKAVAESIISILDQVQ
ncbi:MAG: DNA cytosine methyltransferase [Faecalibacterium prausnitzii]